MNVGHILDDGRLDHHQATQNHMAIYGAAGALRSNSSNSSSPGGIGVHNVGSSGLSAPGIGGLSHGHPNTPAALLVVPQPINATKIGASANGPGTGRRVSYYFYLFSINNKLNQRHTTCLIYSKNFFFFSILNHIFL